MWPAGTVAISAPSSRSKRPGGITITTMWTWIKRRRALKFQIACALTEAAQNHALASRLLTENSELRAMVVQLDAAVTDLSIQLWGKRAYDRAVDQARRNGNN
jgi:hypothetical protein